MSRGALSVGADGLLVEVVESEQARRALKCDAAQGIPPDVLDRIVAAAETARAHPAATNATLH